MASTNKTPYLALSQWLGTDKPKRADFNSDNLLIDQALQTHLEEGEIHLTPQERERWNAPYLAGSYQGDGAAGRTIELGFAPAFGLVCCTGDLPFFQMHNTTLNYGETRWGIFSAKGCTAGITMTGEGTGFTVLQHETAPMNGRKLCLNQAGITYLYIAFR